MNDSPSPKPGAPTSSHELQPQPPTGAACAGDVSLAGLTASEVLARRQRDGWNELPSARGRSLRANVIALLREPMTLLLLVCGSIYMALGDSSEGVMLLGFVVFITALTGR